MRIWISTSRDVETERSIHLPPGGGYIRYIRTPGKQRSKLLLDLVRVPEIVGIDRSDIIALRLRNGAVACRGNTRVGLPDYPNTWIFVSVVLNDLGRCIAGTVVDNDYFQIAMGLRPDAIKRLVDGRRRIVCRDDHRHEIKPILHVVQPPKMKSRSDTRDDKSNRSRPMPIRRV